MRDKRSKYGVMICMPRPSDKRIVDETAEYIRQEMKISWVGLAKGGVYAEAPEYARNAMVKEAKEGDITHIFMLDADTVPPDNTILRLLVHGRDIIAGVSPIFVQGRKCWSFSLDKPTCGENEVNVLDKEISGPIMQKLSNYGRLPRKPFKVNGLTGSTALIKIDVFKELAMPWYKTIRDKSGMMVMGHDFYFGNLARQAGFELWVDPTIQCKHYNTVELNSVFTGA